MSIEQIPSTGEWGDIADLLNSNFAEDSVFFDAYTISTIGPISDDDTDPTLIDGLTMSAQNGGFELVTTGNWADTGAILNNTGFDIDDIGQFDFYPNNSGGTSRIDMWSETSTDGVTVTVTPMSARSIEVNGTSESSQSKSSRISEWKNGEMLRFAFTDSGGGSIQLESPSVNARGGTVSASSFSWRLVAVKKVAV